MPQVIVVGAGPAGISAACYIRRANFSVKIIANGVGALEKAEKIENYYGFPSAISGKELAERGIQNARRLGCEILSQEVLSISYNNRFEVVTNQNHYEADAVILATGAPRRSLSLKGFSSFEGKGISYCAVCDAFFYRGKDVAVLGNGEYALHEARELLPVAGSVTLLTNGLKPPASLPDRLKLNCLPLSSLEGEGTLSRVCFENGESLFVSGLFVALGIASSADLAKKLGAETDGNRIMVNEKMETNIPGLYAAGDCTGGLLQIAKAVSDGAIAGTEAIKFIRKMQ